MTEVCEKCGKTIRSSTVEVCNRYEELEGKIYCPTHRNELLPDYVCKGCGNLIKPEYRDDSIKKYGEVFCIQCQQKGIAIPNSDNGAITPTEVISPIVLPAVGAADAIDAWKAFQDLKKSVKTEYDITVIRNKEYLNKSFWRKMATFFNLTDKILEKEIITDDYGQIISAYYEVVVVAPNGRETVGVGFCGISERSGGRNSFAHPDHDIRATAHCVPARAEILTKNGFKSYTEIVIGEDVLSYSVNDDRCYWVPLENITTYRNLPMVKITNQSFRSICTPDHSWVIEKDGKYKISPKRELCPLNSLKKRSSIILAAMSENGDADISPREASILGWILTDGTIRYQTIKSKKYIRVHVDQSKPKYVTELRELFGDDVTISTVKPHKRTFPQGYTSNCLESYRFSFKTKFIKHLLEKASIKNKDTSLVSLATNLTHASRKSMLISMLKGDGQRKGNAWIFNNSRRNIFDLFQVLAILEGYGLGQETTNGKNVMRQTMRVHRKAYVPSLKFTVSEQESAWCPTTKYGTWIMRLDSQISITGNTRAKNRAISDMIAGGEVSAEEVCDKVQVD